MNKIAALFLAIAGTSILTVAAAAAAEIAPFVTGDGTADPGVWDLVGPIITGDDERLQKAVDQGRKSVGNHFVRVFSDGGDVETALKMGRILRSVDHGVLVPRPGYCRSACVFLLAGAAVRRVVGADIAIHRPYFVDLDPTLSARSVDTRYKRLTREIYEFLAEMNVPAALADAMFTIRPDEGHRLTADELTRYMLDQDDPAHDERRVAKSAAEIGVSMTEYRRREAVFDALAVPVGKVLDCFTAVIREGLNPSTDGRCSAQ